MRLFVVVIHDDPPLRDLFAEMLAAWIEREVTVEKVGYAARLAGPMRRWIEAADLFVLGLERHYPQGRCAEGVDTAEKLFQVGKRALVVGSECKARRVDVPFYWDIGADRSFLDAVRRNLDSPLPSPQDRKKLWELFENRRRKPVGHGS